MFTYNIISNMPLPITLSNQISQQTSKYRVVSFYYAFTQIKKKSNYLD